MSLNVKKLKFTDPMTEMTSKSSLFVCMSVAIQILFQAKLKTFVFNEITFIVALITGYLPIHTYPLLTWQST